MDKDKLIEAMKRKNISDKQMYDYLGLSRSAWYRKKNGISEFTRSEIEQIVIYLELDSPVEIFFPLKVS